MTGDPELRAGNNALRARLDAAAEALGISLDDLTVLAPQNDPYRRDTAAGHRDAAWLAEQVARLVPHGDIHLRGLHYKLVGTARKPDGTPYVNNDTTWQWLQEKPAKAARWLGYVPFDRIRDERNGAPEIFVRGDDGSSGWGSLSDGGGMLELPALSSVLPSVLAIPPRPRQPYRIVLIGEKSSLAAELLPVANRADELVLPTGEASDTLIAEMAARADQDGRPTIVLYFADFDPAGWQMPVSVSRKLQALRDLHHPDLQIDVHRVCLTLDQVRAFDLPSSPLKETERRGDRWVAIMRRAQTEIDALAALHPGAIGRLAEDAIAPFFDSTLTRRAAEAAEAWRAEATERLLSSEGYGTACAVIENALAGVTAAAEAMKEAQAEALSMLPRFGDKRIACPDPHIVGTAPEPLFSSADDFATASRKLIAAKRLDGAVP